MTHIIATIGPVSNTPEKISALVTAGVDFFRLNFSHGSQQWHADRIAVLRKTAPRIPIILDTKGPEMRTGDMPLDVPEISLPTGSVLTLVLDEKNTHYHDPEKYAIFVNHAGLGNDLEKGDIISIDSGLIEVQVKKISADKQSITTTILHGGKISSRRHVNLVKKDVSLSTITPHDDNDIRFGLKHGIDIIALSFLRCPTGIHTVRTICEEEFRHDVKIWAKIESQLGIENLSKIAAVADGLMVARGDLGVETPLEAVPYRQREILDAARKNNIFSIVATEMLESMTAQPRPTRAEVSDVSLAVWEGANAVMLSGETANGKYPVETVEIMKKIVDSAEKSGITLL